MAKTTAMDRNMAKGPSPLTPDTVSPNSASVMALSHAFRREVPRQEQRGIDLELRLAKVEIASPIRQEAVYVWSFTLTRASSSQRLEPLRHVDAAFSTSLL